MNNILDSFVDFKSVFIVGRRWFERTNGNTYHSSEIYVNNKLVHKIDFCYGYGNQFEYTAFDWLKKNGYISCDSNEAPWRFFQERDISYNSSVTDVRRKKDL